MSTGELGAITVDFVQPSAWRRIYELRQDGAVIGRLRRSWWTATAGAETDRYGWRITVRGMIRSRATVTDEASGQVIAQLKDRTVMINGGPTLVWRRFGRHKGKGWACITVEGREAIRAQVSRGFFRLAVVRFTLAPELSRRDKLLCMFLTSHLWLQHVESRTAAGAAAGGAAAAGAG